MIVTAETFWRELRHRWDPEDPVKLRTVAGAVLFELRERLPSQEALRVFSQLPSEIGDLSTTPSMAQLEREGHRRIVDVDAPAFYRAVAHRADVDTLTAEEATPAVLSALKDALTEDAASRVPAELPPNLAQLWRDA